MNYPRIPPQNNAGVFGEAPFRFLSYKKGFLSCCGVLSCLFLLQEMSTHMNRPGRPGGKLVPIDENSISSKAQKPGTISLSSRTIQHKKDLVEAVRRSNPAGCVPAPGIFWDVEGNLKTTNIDSSGLNQQVVIVENGVNHAARKFNDLKTLNDRKTKVLKDKLDEMEAVKSEAQNLYDMSHAATEEAARIEMLQEESTKVQASIYKRVHTTRQLEHMLSRLNRNQIKFDAHLNGMEEAMKAVEKEGAEMILLRKGLDAGLAKAVAVVDETKESLKNSRVTREVLLGQRRNELKTANRLQDWLASREQTKRDLAKELRGDLTREEEYILKTQLQDKEEKTRTLQRANEESQRKVTAMEEAFQEIKQVTGGSTVEEIVEKFASQRKNKINLEREIKETEKKLNQERRKLHKEEEYFEEIKSSSLGSAELNREMVNALDAKTMTSKNDHKVIRAAGERLEAVLVGLRQGAQGLLQRVKPYQNITEGGSFEAGHLDEDLEWAKVMDMLGTAEHVLSKMLETVAGGADMGMVLPDEEEESVAGSVATAVEAPDDTYNIRITSRKELRDGEVKEEKDVAGDGEPTSNTLGMELLLRPDEDMHDKGRGRSSGDVYIDGDVLTRLGVKKTSNRMSTDAQRRIDMGVRRKLLADMQGKGSDGAADEEALMKAAKLKAQRAMANRLSTFPHPATLPEGITLRDDAMTKTKAFLTSRPHLL